MLQETALLRRRDKRERQVAVMKYYIDGNDHALDAFPGGSEPGT